MVEATHLIDGFRMRREQGSLKCCKHGCARESVCLVTDLCDVGTNSSSVMYICSI